MDSDGLRSQEARRRGTALRASGRFAAPARRSVRSSELRFGRPPRPVRSPLHRGKSIQQEKMMDTDRGKDGCRWMHRALICIYPSFSSGSIQNFYCVFYPDARREDGDGRTGARGLTDGRVRPSGGRVAARRAAPSRRSYRLLSVCICVHLWFRPSRRLSAGPRRLGGERFVASSPRFQIRIA